MVSFPPLICIIDFSPFFVNEMTSSHTRGFAYGGLVQTIFQQRTQVKPQRRYVPNNYCGGQGQYRILLCDEADKTHIAGLV